MKYILLALLLASASARVDVDVIEKHQDWTYLIDSVGTYGAGTRKDGYAFMLLSKDGKMVAYIASKKNFTKDRKIIYQVDQNEMVKIETLGKGKRLWLSKLIISGVLSDAVITTYAMCNRIY